MLGQGADDGLERGSDPRRGAVVGQREQQAEPGGALGQHPDLGAGGAQQQVAFPVAGHGPVAGLGGPLGDVDPVGELARAVAVLAGGVLVAQVLDQFGFQAAAALDVERRVDRFG